MKGVEFEQILKDLQDREPEIKRLAAQAMITHPLSQESVFALLEVADKPTTLAIYEALYEAEEDYSTIFLRATDDEDPRIRRQAIRYLFRRGTFTVEDGMRWLADIDPYVRRRVISYLSWINGRQALDPIVRLATQDPDSLVKRDALRIIAMWGDRQDAGSIIAALEDRDSTVRTQALITLKRITGEDFGEPLGRSEDEMEWIVAKWRGWWEIVKEGS